MLKGRIFLVSPSLPAIPTPEILQALLGIIDCMSGVRYLVESRELLRSLYTALLQEGSLALTRVFAYFCHIPYTESDSQNPKMLEASIQTSRRRSHAATSKRPRRNRREERVKIHQAHVV